LPPRADAPFALPGEILSERWGIGPIDAGVLRLSIRRFCTARAMHRRRPMRSIERAPWIIGLLFAAGCASVPAPTERIVSARAAIRSAAEVGATGDPSAALHLKLAQNSYDEADRLVAEEDNEAATCILMRAEADAELAIVLTRAARANDTARQSEQRLVAQRQRAESSR
jgi:hypothetical protein